DSVRLFVERAAEALPAFTLAPDNAACVAHICRRLDGIPLAIELAAARVKILSVEQIAVRLDDAARLLKSTTAQDPRHATLKAAMDWSYQFLTPPEQAVFRRLSVFASSFTLEAAEEVTGDRLQVTGNREQGTGVQEPALSPVTSNLSPTDVLDLLDH